MRTLLLTIIMCQFFLLGTVTGYSYLLYKETEHQEICMEQMLKKSMTLKDYFGHKIEKENIWIHAQAAVSNEYLSCMARRGR